jgi:PAS domain S-box-containing protein
MPAEPARATLSRLTWKLPLSIAVLLLGVVVSLTWIAHREVRQLEVEAAGGRISEVLTRLSTVFSRSVALRRVETVAIASNPALRGALTGAGTGEAELVMDSVLAANAQIGVVQLWDDAGRRVLSRRGRDAAAFPTDAFRPPDWARGDSVSFSDLRAAEGFVWYEVTAPVNDDGWLVQYRLFASTAAAQQVIGDLIGMDAAVFVGTPGGTWTDLTRSVEGPPARLIGAAAPVEYQREDGSWRLGSTMSVPGTPWAVWVEFPRDLVLARADSFIPRMVPIGLLLVGLGALAGLGLSRGVTVDLRRMKSATMAIAQGDYGRRVEVRRADEIGDVASAFNTMAERVEDAHHRLEELVAARTEQLRASEEQFRNLAAAANDAIIAGDDEGRITYFNAGAERVFGYDAEEVRGKPFTVLIPEQLHLPYLRDVLGTIRRGGGGKQGTTVEWMARRKDGTEVPVELSLAAWELEGSQAFVAILRDITDRIATHQSLQRYASELEASNQELEAFCYSVSHDLRAPLRSIHGFSHALVEDYSSRLDEQGIDYLKRVCAGADRMGHLIDDLLELSRATRTDMHFEDVDLGEIATRIASGLLEETPHRQVDFVIGDDLVVKGDRRLLAQVMQNLLENAFKFTSRKPTARIEVGADDETGALFVRDDGAGFDPAYMDKLFGAFQRLHSPKEFPGTGVGLALVQRIVTRHGGRVWAEGQPDSGATFFFTLQRQRAFHGAISA